MKKLFISSLLSLIFINTAFAEKVGKIDSMIIQGKSLPGETWTQELVLKTINKPTKKRAGTQQCGYRLNGDNGFEEVYKKYGLILETEENQRALFDLKFTGYKNALILNGVRVDQKMTKRIFFEKFKPYLVNPNIRENDALFNTNHEVETGGYRFVFKKGHVDSVHVWFQC